MNISDINKYKKYIENGIYENSIVEKMSDRYSKQEQQSISHLDILFSSSRANTIIKNNVTYKCIVDYGGLPKKSSSTQSLQNRELWTKHSDDFSTGDIVQFVHNPYDISQRKTYILINKIETRVGYELHIMQPCISSLKWLDENGQVCEAPFTYRLDFYRGSGTDDGKIVIIPQERRYIYVQRNDDTLKIKRDKRFIFDGRVWKVTAYDTLLSGLIYLELEEDEINPAVDNVELRIADYAGNVANYAISILNGNAFSIHAGTTLQLDVEVLNNGQIVNKDLIFTSNDESIATVDSNGLVTSYANGTVVITVKLADDETIADSITGTVQFETVNNYSVSLMESPIILNNTSKTFTVQVMNNGAIQPTKFVTWQLYDDNQTSATTLATMIFSSTTQCTLKGHGTGYVKLRIQVIGEPQIHWLRVQIKGLI